MTEHTKNRFRNANVLVTGANRGLGRALVEAALEASARRVYATARDVKKLEPLVRLHPERVVALELDVTDTRSIAAAAEHARDVDILINNAGVLASYDVLASKPEELALDFSTNVFGVVETTKAFLPALAREQRGALVNVLSIVSLASMPAIGGYSAAKAAAYSVTQALRGELARRGVSVHAVLPGPVDTDMIRSMPMAKTSPELVARAIIDGVEAGAEEIFPDPASRQMFALFQKDARAFAAQLAAG
jgi:short-subunit dehydrogenase